MGQAGDGAYGFKRVIGKGGVPQLNGCGEVHCGKGSAVGAECRKVATGRGDAERRADSQWRTDRCVSCDVPQADHSVEGRRGEDLSVCAEYSRLHLTGAEG